jgi:hypothetical protein
MYERAYVYIEGFAQKLGIDPGCAVRQFDIWLRNEVMEVQGNSQVGEHEN